MTPLAKRLPRELKNNIGKYLGIFLLMCGAIALTSGFLLAAHSISQIIDGMHGEYTIEDGRLATSFEATDNQLQAARDAAEDVGGVTLFDNYSIDAAITLPNDDGTKRTLRTYKHRTQVDIAAYCEGSEPATENEVAIDRVFAKNNDIHVGDTVDLEGSAYTVCGIMTQPDSQALFLNNSDFTVNTITYGVAEVSPAGFEALKDAGGAPTYTYSFTFANRNLSVADRTDAEKDMAEAMPMQISTTSPMQAPTKELATPQTMLKAIRPCGPPCSTSSSLSWHSYSWCLPTPPSNRKAPSSAPFWQVDIAEARLSCTI